MSEMIERVAKAIYDHPTRFDGDPIGVHLSGSMMIDGSAKDANQLRQFVMEVCEDAARAAIEAMMEPTEQMIEARFRTLGKGGKAEWEASITAALS